MSLQKFIQLFEREFEEVPPGTITADKNFKEVIQMNSMNTVMLLGFIKAEYNIDLIVEDLFADFTFGEFYSKYIQPHE
ncbi:MAG: hypothetical protein U0U67_14395 [Chitinophagales bacterium]